MEDFKKYLLEKRITTPKQADFYVHWVVKLYNHSGKRPGEALNSEEIERFIHSEERRKESWQIRQAREAIAIYRYRMERRPEAWDREKVASKEQWRAVASEMEKVMRLRHMSLRTEKAYRQWVRRFYRYVQGMAPEDLTGGHVKGFVTHLAVDDRVAASTQNQAFCALLFMYRYVLDKPIENIGEAVRAKRKKRLPVVLTQGELRKLLSKMSGVNLLMARIVYGAGLRLQECLQLRVHDIDMDRRTIIVRGGKGDKDRETVLPDSVVDDLMDHLVKVKKLYVKDREQNIAGVAMPNALERKLKSAAVEWGWFWVFPSCKLSVDPRSGIVRRHHAHPSVLQKHIKAAAFRAGIHKRVTVHTLRHCFATHLVENKCDIRTIQELLGHRNLETTMVYTHVAQTNRLGIPSPLDREDSGSE